jgi:hypothetical protein
MWNHKVEDWGHLKLKQNYQNQIDYLTVDYITIDFIVASFFLSNSFAIDIELVKKHEDLYSLHVYMYVPSSFRMKNK